MHHLLSVFDFDVHTVTLLLTRAEYMKHLVKSNLLTTILQFKVLTSFFFA